MTRHTNGHSKPCEHSHNKRCVCSCKGVYHGHIYKFNTKLTEFDSEDTGKFATIRSVSEV